MTTEIYLVQEYEIDYDDYPIGIKRTLFVTADEVRAKEATDWQKSDEWQMRWCTHRTSRSIEILHVEDVDEDDALRRSYGPDDEGVYVDAKLTDEGVIVDVFDENDVFVYSFARTWMEFIDHAKRPS